MDLMDFDQAALYFDDPISPEVERLIAQAGAGYGSDETESLLLRAYFLAPGQLVVLVALYRTYFYQHRLDDALIVADRALAVAGGRLNFPDMWQQLHPQHLGYAAMRSIGLLRFYLMVLKAAGDGQPRPPGRQEPARRLPQRPARRSRSMNSERPHTPTKG
jgi:hypothetical protein